MKEILVKCAHTDFENISEILDSYISFTDDAGRKKLLQKSRDSAEDKRKLIITMDRQIRYYGSSDVAYIFRSIFSENSDGGISSLELIEDVCNKLKISIKHGGSVENRLERLTNAVVEKEIFSKSPTELHEAFKKIGMGDVDMNIIEEHLIKNGKVAVIPVLIEVLGPKMAFGIIETIIVTLIAQIIGREAAKAIIKEAMKRNPWLNALGPVMWTLSGIWLAFDMQGPAYRKTVPICLYLGIVALRDGPEIN